MQRAIGHFKRYADTASCVSQIVDAAHDVICMAGFDSLIYDFSPVATTPQGELVIPSHFSHRNVPGEMRYLWCEEKYHQHDPVQQIALTRSAPFVWSYRNKGQNNVLASHLDSEHVRVTEYLHDTGLTCGITVPLHRTSGGFATFTAIQRNGAASFLNEALHIMQQIGLIGQITHEATMEHFAPNEMKSSGPSLTSRQAECLQYSAQGYTAEEIAKLLGRSVPTATLHLKSAVTRLGARNRAHAIALALHYKLIHL